METVLNVIVGFFVLVGLGVFGFIVIPAFTKAYHQKKPMNKLELKALLDSFNDTQLEHKSGKLFVDLLSCGYFQHLKTGNHGNNFSDERQYNGFLKYATPQIAESLQKIGDSLDKYIV